MENLGPILWFIIIGAIFYFMMKKGGCCGGGSGSDTGKENQWHEHRKVSDAERKNENPEHKHKGGCC